MNVTHRVLHPSELALPSVLLKATMASTGLVLAGWLTLHMLGNWTLFAGPRLMNAYSHELRDSGLLWPQRVFMLLTLLIHVLCAIVTSLRARAARPVRYRVPLRAAAATAASLSMRFTGALLLGYLAYHVALLYGVGHPDYVPGDVRHNLLVVLGSPLPALVNVVAVGLVCLHLAHGLASSLISLGWAPIGRPARIVRRAMQCWAVLVTAGFAIVSVAPWLGWV